MAWARGRTIRPGSQHRCLVISYRWTKHPGSHGREEAMGSNGAAYHREGRLSGAARFARREVLADQLSTVCVAKCGSERRAVRLLDETRQPLGSSLNTELLGDQPSDGIFRS